MTTASAAKATPSTSKSPAAKKSAPFRAPAARVATTPKDPAAKVATPKAAASMARDVDAPADEIVEAIAALEAEANGTRKAVKKSPVAKVPAVRTSHADCTHEKVGREGKKARAACRRERTAAEAAK